MLEWAWCQYVGFQSTPPARGATPVEGTGKTPFPIFQSTPPARGATFEIAPTVPNLGISIHAPREGGDSSVPVMVLISQDFNPRPPRGGRHRLLQKPWPVRGISIHAPREGGDDGGLALGATHSIISIHAPREGGDRKDAQFYLRIFDK